MAVKQVSCIADLIGALQADHGTYDWPLWFRGHARPDWKLLPGYLRLKNAPSESTLQKRFKQSAALLLDRLPAGSFDWAFHMQHYGIPTRLLDWSESPLVGLYFALYDAANPPDTDASLWVLRPIDLNRNANIIDEREADFIPSFEDDELTNYSHDRLVGQRVKLKPIASLATRNNIRIQAQQGVFTIHHLDTTPIEEIGDKSHVTRYDIPVASIPNIKRELRLLGYSKFTMFPELSSVGENIRMGLS